MAQVRTSPHRGPGSAPTGQAVIQASTPSVLLEKSSRRELGSARCSDGDGTDTEKLNPSFDHDLGHARSPTPVDRTPADNEDRSICPGEAACLRCRASRGAKRSERDGSGGERCCVRRRCSLKTTRQGQTDVGDTNRQDHHEGSDREEQDRCRALLLAHRSTLIEARPTISTATPPKSGAATR